MDTINTPPHPLSTDKYAYRLVVGLRDVEQAQHILKTLLPKDRVFDVLDGALETAAVVSYSRPFKQGKLGLDKTKWPNFEDPDFVELHKYILHVRDKNYAHGDLAIRKAIYWHDGHRNAGSAIYRRLHWADIAAFKDMTQDLATRLQHALDDHLATLEPLERTIEYQPNDTLSSDNPWRERYLKEHYKENQHLYEGPLGIPLSPMT